MKRLIVIADWVSDSLAVAEVKIAFAGYLQSQNLPDITFISSTPSTIHTGFILEQIVYDVERFGSPLETVIFQNTDPRLEFKEKTKNAEGAKPLIIRLKSGLYLLGPNAGYNFSFIKRKIEEIFIYVGLNEEGQFHSRDVFSRISAHLVNYQEDELDLEEVSTAIIPELRGYFVAHIDNYGNIKTTIKKNDFKGRFEFEDEVLVRINKVTQRAKFVTNLFGGKPGELVIYPGSSGQLDNRYLEITSWQYFTEEKPKTGKDYFHNPREGQLIEILNG